MHFWVYSFKEKNDRRGRAVNKPNALYPESCFALCLCDNQLSSTDLMVTLWIHKPFIFFAESVTVCHGGHRTRCKQTPHDLQTKLLYTAAKPWQLEVKTIVRKRTVYPGMDLLQKKGQHIPTPRPSQGWLCQVTGTPRYWSVSTGKGAIGHCRTFTSGCWFPHRYARLRFKKW